MIRLNIRMALRNLKKNRFFTAINISALALGITLCLLILMYVINEFSYENFQKNKKRIFRITAEWGAEGNKMKFAGIMPAMGPAIDSAYSQVEAEVRLINDYGSTITTESKEKIEENNSLYADKDFFRIFSINLIQGDPDKALADPFSIVITRKIASKYFHSTDVIGKTLIYDDKPMKITGLMSDAPENTHLRPDMLVSYTTRAASGQKDEHPWNQWGEVLTYILLQKGVSSASVLPFVNNLFSKNAGEYLAARMHFELQPLTAIHWDTEIRSDIGDKSEKMYIYIFLSAAIFVLIIACFNFLNLSISQYLSRLKEIGIRKTAGAFKRQLVNQFLTESGIIIAIATILAVVLFEILYLKLYTYLGASYVLQNKHLISLLLIVVLIVFLVGTLAGLYPAFYISRFTPIEILRNETTGVKSRLTFRKILVILQFFITVVLLVGTIVLQRQLNYMKNSDLGFRKDDVAIVSLGNSDDAGQKYRVFRSELLRNPGISSVSGAFTVPGINSMQSFSARKEASAPESSVNLQGIPVDVDFVKSLGLEIVEGRDFSEQFPGDLTTGIIVNQTAVKVLGLTDPIGARIEIPGSENKEREVKIIGVVRDFHIRSFRNKISPMVLYINPQMYICALVRMVPGNRIAMSDYIKATYKSAFPGNTINFKYLDDAYAGLYKSERKSGEVLSVFTIFALLISCLGLFGFTSFIVARRVKEVGIRKVLGARVTGISLMLSRQFAIWIIISGIMAIPVSYFIASRWLSSFAFRTGISWWIFLAAIVIELVIALTTISFHLIRVAIKNPVESLRYE